MRKEPFEQGDYVHVYARGHRKENIVRDARDRWHFLQTIYYFNNINSMANPFRELRELLKLNFNKRLAWPSTWPPQQPIVKILAFSLVENHYHLQLKEEKEGGVTTFMRRVNTSIAKYFNTKYKEEGRLFQGSFGARKVRNDEDLAYLSVYIQVKNILELYPGGLVAAKKNFNHAFQWAVEYPYGSLGDYAGTRNSPIIDKEVLGKIFPTKEGYLKFAKECFLGMNLKNKLGGLVFQD